MLSAQGQNASSNEAFHESVAGARNRSVPSKCSPFDRELLVDSARKLPGIARCWQFGGGTTMRAAIRG
jgi:hypothetical protein